ncbi:MAG: nucleotide exchange factor GrpE [Candidatus Omnitrophica bacterium CG07_land_8_20_14_0_80_42_15]|uniref:Protein GrpE n=1 Tax=Candidatus Aquitaenariimonas noxiae TaxID=1974741 RepID=A0A2J0KUN3_9BACT|nr:MAG: nucleotide exchange factor GrpE [Candidatus Omnitrophica bacterium CG07_land_8_20_14_0_80_42_15]
MKKRAKEIHNILAEGPSGSPGEPVKNGGSPEKLREKHKAAGEEVVMTNEEYELLKVRAEERDKFYDKYVRSQAEFENALKRFDREKESILKYANEGFISDFLPIVDSLEMSERHIKEAKDFEAVRVGVDMIHGQIQKFLKELGVERIKSVGEKLDPNIHDVVDIVESDDMEEGIIVEELKAGYKLNGKVIRPAAVKVVKKKSKAENNNIN